MRVRLFSDIGHVMTKIDWEEPTEIKMCMYTVCMTTYERVKPATAGPVANINKLKMICLFYFILESEKKNSHNVGTAVVPEKLFYFSPFYSFFISIPNVNSNWFLD